MVNFGEVWRAQLAKSSLLNFNLVPLGSFKMRKRGWGVESNGKLSHLLNPNKTPTLVPEFAVADLPLVTTADLVPEFAVKDLPLGRKHC